jgi:hypothetical protein
MRNRSEQNKRAEQKTDQNRTEQIRTGKRWNFTALNPLLSFKKKKNALSPGPHQEQNASRIATQPTYL